MKLAMGLGNPGRKYEGTRHNVGFLVVNRLWSMVSGDKEWKTEKKFSAVVCRPNTVDVILVKPTTFMNDSGIAIASLTTFYKLHTTDLYIVHDDLDIKLGEYKIQLGKGPKNHNGLLSIYKHLGTKDFWHVRIGVDSQSRYLPSSIYHLPIKFKLFKFSNHKQKISGDEYVLQPFTPNELEVLGKVTDSIIKDLFSIFKIDQSKNQ